MSGDSRVANPPVLEEASGGIYLGFCSRKLRECFVCIMGGTGSRSVPDGEGLYVLSPWVRMLCGQEGREGRRPPPWGVPSARGGSGAQHGKHTSAGSSMWTPAELAHLQRARRWESRSPRDLRAHCSHLRGPRHLAGSDAPGIWTKGSQLWAPALQNSFREERSPPPTFGNQMCVSLCVLGFHF